MKSLPVNGLNLSALALCRKPCRRSIPGFFRSGFPETRILKWRFRSMWNGTPAGTRGVVITKAGSGYQCSDWAFRSNENSQNKGFLLRESLVLLVSAFPLPALEVIFPGLVEKGPHPALTPIGGSDTAHGSFLRVFLGTL